ncbi:hypothetical protein [Nesterenkonia ebinurensis]|uniref:hypothetical protein n=1 Tax=Nesterenkonia ebinurensis TaxID=2608252 RepID=UPI00123D54AE|nr:hypothetical protein [Nesterenkonia ebinurensis]
MYRRLSPARTTAALSLITILGLTACNADEEDGSSPEPDPAGETAEPEPEEDLEDQNGEAEEEEPAAEDPEGDEQDGGESVEGADGQQPVDEADLPGELVEGDAGEYPAGLYSPILVPADTELLVRTTPGQDAEILLESAGAMAMEHTGREVQLEDGVWLEMEIAEEDPAHALFGWVHSDYAGQLAELPSEETDQAELAERISDAGPAEDPEAVVHEVAENYISAHATDGSSPEYEIVHVSEGGDVSIDEDGPSLEGDVEYQVDMVGGMMDDSLRGQRIHITLEETEQGFAPAGVAFQSICARGLDEETPECL